MLAMTKLMALFVFVLPLGAIAADAPLIETTRDDAAISIKQGDQVLAKYQLQPDRNAELAVESACYFHPLKTPAGVTVTEFAPPDHPHHRGVFLGFVEMRGDVDADFWGWGEHAPKDGRRIVNRAIRKLPDGSANGFVAINQWVAGDDVVIDEQLRAEVRLIGNVTVLDLQYTLDPKFEIRLPRWAFSGFCVRTRLDGQLQAFGRDGRVDLPDPSHLKPDTDWPAAMWYGYQFRGVNRAAGDGGVTIGVAVVDHPKNPPSRWHNHRGVGMLNPCVVAPTEVRLKVGEPLVLRYRVIAFDGELPRDRIQRLAEDFRKNYPPN
jgi:hypothetical protein